MGVAVGCLFSGVGFGSGFWVFIVFLGWSMGVSDVRVRPCVVGEGFHALHWKMLSWFVFGCLMRALRILRWPWVVRDARGEFIVGFLRVIGLWCVGWGSLCGVGVLC